MNRLVKVLASSLLAMMLLGCSQTRYSLPDYYQTGLVPKQLHPGQTYYVNHLRCHSPNQDCQQPVKPSKAEGNRNYAKKYYFE